MHLTDEAFRQSLLQDWKDHTKRPREIIDRLGEKLSAPMSDAALRELSALACHVYGEHLGHWQAGTEYLERLLALHRDASSDAKFRVERQQAVLIKAADCSRRLNDLRSSDRYYVTALAMPAATLQKSVEEGRLLYFEALELLDELDSPESRRLFSVVTANLVCDLLDRDALSAGEQQFLLILAEKSHNLWTREGDESDRRRAVFRLIQSYQACLRPENYATGRYPRYAWIKP